MKKNNIIKESYEFTEIINTGNTIKNKYYSIFYKNKIKDINRYGITIPKKIGKSVIRNKIKRQIKNIIDTNELYIQKSYDYVIIIKKHILNLTYQEEKEQLMDLFNKIGEKNEKTN